MKNQKRNKPLFKGKSQTFALFYPFFILLIIVFIVSFKNNWSFLILILGILTSGLFQLWFMGQTYFIYRIFEDKLYINYPIGITKKEVKIKYSNVNRFEFDDSMSSGAFNPASSFILFVDLKKYNLHFTNKEQIDLILLIKCLKKHDVELNIYSKNPRILNAIQDG